MASLTARAPAAGAASGRAAQRSAVCSLRPASVRTPARQGELGSGAAPGAQPGSGFFFGARVRLSGGHHQPLAQHLLQAVRADAATDQMDAATLQLIADITKKVDTAVAETIKANAAAAEGLDLTNHSHELRAKVVAGIRKLSKGLLERETEVRWIV